METEDLLNSLEGKLNPSSDVSKAMEEFFKDKLDKEDGFLHDIDLRSRLIAKSIRGHSVINFLGGIKVKEANNHSLAEGLEILSISLKRHVLSFEGKSRQEIINLFQAQAEAKKAQANFSMFQPQK